MASPAATTARWISRHGLLALTLWVIAIGLVAISAIDAPEGIGPVDIAWTGSILVTATVGAVVSSRVPRNPIGWIFLGIS